MECKFIEYGGSKLSKYEFVECKFTECNYTDMELIAQ